MGRRAHDKCENVECNRKIFARGRCLKHYHELPRMYVRADGPMLSYWGLRERLIEIPDELKRVAMITTYLLGSRRSEVVELKRKDFYTEHINGIPHIICRSPVRKNRRSKQKFFPINTRYEQTYCEILQAWLDKLQPEDWVFRIAYLSKPTHLEPTTLYKWTRKTFGIDFPTHWFRKLRATHLLNGVQNEDGTWHIPPLPPHIVKRLMGWTDMRPLEAYERYMVTDTARAMMPPKPY